MKTIREQIINFLASSQMTASKLSKESGVSPANISRIRSGKRKDCSSRIADALRSAMIRLDSEAARSALSE